MKRLGQNLSQMSNQFMLSNKKLMIDLCKNVKHYLSFYIKVKICPRNISLLQKTNQRYKF